MRNTDNPEASPPDAGRSAEQCGPSLEPQGLCRRCDPPAPQNPSLHEAKGLKRHKTKFIYTVWLDMRAVYKCLSWKHHNQPVYKVSWDTAGGTFLSYDFFKLKRRANTLSILEKETSA